MTDVKEVIISQHTNIQLLSCATETGMLYVNYTSIFEKKEKQRVYGFEKGLIQSCRCLQGEVSSFPSNGSIRRLPLVAVLVSTFFFMSSAKTFDSPLAQIKARNCIPLTDWGLNKLLESERWKPLTGSACFVVLFLFGFVCLLFLSVICSV